MKGTDNGLEVSNGSTGRDGKEGWNDLTGMGVDKVVRIGYGITRFLYLGTIMTNNIRCIQGHLSAGLEQ